VKTSTSFSLADDFIKESVSDIKKRFEKEILAHCEEYGREISHKLYLEAMKNLNGLRVDFNQSLGRNVLEIRISVFKEEEPSKPKNKPKNTPTNARR